MSGNKAIKQASLEELQDFEKISKSIIDFIKINWDVKAKPKDYAEFLKDYEEGKCMGEMVPEFKGFDDSTASKPSFASLMSTPSVAYSDKEQDRNPLHTMISSILAHGILIGERRGELKNKASVDDFLIGAMKRFLAQTQENDAHLDIIKVRATNLAELLNIKFPEIEKLQS